MSKQPPTLSSNKRIAKNTGMLYFRMLLMMIVTLYTSRVVLNTLGVEDFGIYNVVAGFVTMLAFLSNAMASATQRFLAFEIGAGNKTNLHNVFVMSVNIHFIIAMIILIIAETFGLFFLNTQLTIPVERMEAARWVYHISILMLVVNMISVPYNAMIIAHEEMNVFAWVSIAEVILNLLVVFVLQWFGFDKLKFYAVLLFGVVLLIKGIFGAYCHTKYRESKFRFFWNTALFKTLFSYAAWNLWGSSAGVIMGQGINVLLNVFFGPTVNAAYGIALRVKSAVNQFVNNFQMALNPPIIKSYAADNLQYMHQLIFSGAKYSFFLLFTLSLPLLLETELVLKLWLKMVPEYTVVFVRLALVNILIDSMSRPLVTAAQASGKIKLYQGVVGGVLILNLPISFLFLKLGFPPETTLWISIFVTILAFIARLIIIERLIRLNSREFIFRVVIICLGFSIAALVVPWMLYVRLEGSLVRLFTTGFTSVVFSTISMYFVGLNSNEKIYFKRQISMLFARFKIT